VLNNFVTSENIAGRVSKRLSVLFCDQSSELVCMLLEEGLVLQHVADALGYGHLRPCLERILCVGNCLVELSLRGHRHLGDDILGEWAFDIKTLRRGTLHPLTVDEVFVLKDSF